MTDQTSLSGCPTDCHETRLGQASRPIFSTKILGKLRRLMSDSIAKFKRYRQHRIDRAAFQQVRFLSDDILDDIGVTRSNVEWANKLPIDVSASQALQKTAKRARPRIRP